MWSIISPTGTEVPLTGLSVSIRTTPGAGMAPLEHTTTRLAQHATTIEPPARTGLRKLSLRMVSRQRQATLHTTRLALIDALNPDLARHYGPPSLVYTGGARTLRLPVVYERGLEDVEQDSLELHFLAYTPTWATTEPVTAPQSLTVQASLTSANYLLQRSSAGVWSEVSVFDGAVKALLVAGDGIPHAGGAFTGAVRRWNIVSEQWEALSGISGTVNCLAAGADGRLYAGGTLTAPGSRVAYYDPASDTWVDMGDPEILPYALAVSNDGTVYVGGSDESSPATGITVKQWDGGTTWSSPGSTPGGTVYALLIDTGGTLLAGGIFAGGVKRLIGSLWLDLGNGLTQSAGSTPTVRALARGPDGVIYAGGDFDRADGDIAQFCARWNGVGWLPLGTGTGAAVYALALRPADGLLLAGGAFTVAGELAMPGRAGLWNGYSWFPLDFSLDTAATISSLAALPDGMLLVGYEAQTSATTAAVTTVTNGGSAAACPILTLQGPGRIYEFANRTTGASIYWNLQLLDGEVLTVDMRPAYTTVRSSFRGNLLNSIVPGSRLASWRLLPGENQVSLFIDNVAASATLEWQEQHWSVEQADV